MIVKSWRTSHARHDNDVKNSWAGFLGLVLVLGWVVVVTGLVLSCGIPLHMTLWCHKQRGLGTAKIPPQYRDIGERKQANVTAGTLTIDSSV